MGARGGRLLLVIRGRRRSVSVSVLVLAIAIAATALAACSQSSSPGRSTTSTSVASQSTTSLPTPVPVQGTSVVAGRESFLGSVERVVVPRVPAGATSAALPLPGQPGYASIEQLAFRQFGSGPDLLLVMGEDGTMTWWEPALLSQLAQHYRVTIFDLPGTGYSAPLSTTLSLALLADETAGLIESLGLVRPIVLGWGLGGSVAIALAERHPSSVGSLVLADASAGGPGSHAPAAVQRQLASPWETPTALSGVLFSAASPAERRSFLNGLRSVPPDVVTHAAVVDEARIAALLARSDSLIRGLPKIKLPTLVVDGSEDQVVPPADTAVVAAGIPGAHWIEYQGADYGAIFEEQASFVASLEQFTR